MKNFYKSFTKTVTRDEKDSRINNIHNFNVEKSQMK